MVPVCDKRYHIYNRFRHFWAEIKKLWNYPFQTAQVGLRSNRAGRHVCVHTCFPITPGTLGPYGMWQSIKNSSKCCLFPCVIRLYNSVILQFNNSMFFWHLNFQVFTWALEDVVWFTKLECLKKWQSPKPSISQKYRSCNNKDKNYVCLYCFFIQSCIVHIVC